MITLVLHRVWYCFVSQMHFPMNLLPRLVANVDSRFSMCCCFLCMYTTFWQWISWLFPFWLGSRFSAHPMLRLASSLPQAHRVCRSCDIRYYTHLCDFTWLELLQIGSLNIGPLGRDLELISQTSHDRVTSHGLRWLVMIWLVIPMTSNDFD